jgi:hypothetical protein
MKRRDFITLLGAAAGWPVAAQAQQTERPEKPVIGYLSTLSEAQGVHLLAAFRRGLGEIGLSEGVIWPLNFAGPRVALIAFRPWLPSWFVVLSISCWGKPHLLH